MSKPDAVPAKWYKPRVWSSEVMERADEPVARLMDETRGYAFSWVPKEPVLSLYNSRTKLLAVDPAPLKPWQEPMFGNPNDQLPYSAYWDMDEDDDEVTLMQVIITARAMRLTISNPVSNRQDPLSSNMMGSLTVGEIAFIAARNPNNVLKMGNLSPVAWWNVTSRTRDVAEPHSALVWNMHVHSYPVSLFNFVNNKMETVRNENSFTELFGMTGHDFIPAACEAGMNFDEFIVCLESGYPESLIIESYRNGIDVDLARSLSESAA